MFGGVYGLAVGLAAILGALWFRHSIMPDLALALAFFAVGAAIAGAVSALILNRLPRRIRYGRRLAIAIVSLMVLTTGAHVGLLFAEYASYYAEWWPTAFSGQWFWAALTTFGGVGFYYASIGLPMLLPVGLPALLAFAFVLARE